jgi:hypothetical protein
MVIGGQLSYFPTTLESRSDQLDGDPFTITTDNIDIYFDRSSMTAKNSHFHFHGSETPLFPEGCNSPQLFLSEFSKAPTSKNIIGGATLYAKDLFVRSRALESLGGSKWQAGYELKLGPACYGNTFYLNEPTVVTEVRASNASFRGTQVEHFLDSLASINSAFEAPLQDDDLETQRGFLREVKRDTIHNLALAYLANTLKIDNEDALGLCSRENIAHPVRYRHVWPVLIRNGTARRLIASYFEQHFDHCRSQLRQFGQSFKWALLAVLRPLWLRLPEALRRTIRPRPAPRNSTDVRPPTNLPPPIG